MRLSPDCIRDILLTIEDETDSTKVFVYYKDGDIPKRLKKYSHNEVLYHFQQCNMAEMIVGYRPFDNGDCVHISDLSPYGHQFLANIRQDNIWNNTKEIAGKIGSKSLDTLIQISSSVISELIKAHLGLT